MFAAERNSAMRVILAIFALTAWLGALQGVVPAAAANPDSDTFRKWIQQMKTAERGPFERIRWFCKDGTVLPPKKYACRDHGGGVQHGQWTRQVETIRAGGYAIANIFADIDADQLLRSEGHPDIIKQMILEQFLVGADNGWIFRRARYYRGALQAEDEARGGRELLLGLVAVPGWEKPYFLVLREAARFLPHGRQGAPLSQMRQLSRSLAEADPGFEDLRIKIHVKPELKDAGAVRDYAGGLGEERDSGEYERLALIIEEVFAPRDLNRELTALADQVRRPGLARQIRQRAGQLSQDNPAGVRYAAAARLMAALREKFEAIESAGARLLALDVSLLLEADLFRSGNELIDKVEEDSRRQRLNRLKDGADALYGSGLVSRRQWQALTASLEALSADEIRLSVYKRELEYATRAALWADRWLRFHMGAAVDHMAQIEPLAANYLHDRLRGGGLFIYAAVLDDLLADANRQLGIQSAVFGTPVVSGLTALNPGMARGRLYVAGGEPSTSGETFDPKGIYVLPATTDDLPPVAGILTVGQGNLLSHVQLLARNLGIPNVAVDRKNLSLIQPHAGRRVVLSVSPQGVVRLEVDGPRWGRIFEAETDPAAGPIRPNIDQLELAKRDFISLAELRAEDAGRVCGPKAANLGELKHFFPDAVTEGLVIPFGEFRRMLDQPLELDGPTVFEWMQDRYARISDLAPHSTEREEAVALFLERLRTWFHESDPGRDFQQRLKAAMERVFGAEGSYGVFIRSDTNLEDLPGFTGAGLNLTLPNVVGFDRILAGIRRVWASPFSERAYRWRQAFMEKPEHVYVSVLLMRSVPAEKSGVMVTVDVDSGSADWLTIAVNEGVGGAVSGQTAEELRVHTATGRVRLMSQASETEKRILRDGGGVGERAIEPSDAILDREELRRLTELARDVQDRFPGIRDQSGRPLPADIEFGFYADHLALFQIRPFVESEHARRSTYLGDLDRQLTQNLTRSVDMNAVPGGEQ
jgi:hypothetical protein